MSAPAERHHAVPRCLLRLHDAASGQLGFGDEPMAARVEFELEARRWSVDVSISREDLEDLVASSTEVLDRQAHRLLHESDWARWGRRGGLETVRRHGTDFMAAIALLRWGRISREDLDAMRGLR